MTHTHSVAQAITVLRAAFPRQEISSQVFKDMVALWNEVLVDIPPDVLNLAVMEWISRDTPWFPSVGQIRHIALDLSESEEGSLTPGEAWEEVKRAVCIGGHNYQDGRARWSSPLVQKAFDALGGWRYFRTALLESETADRAHFMRTFEQLQRRQRHLDRLHPAARRLRQGYLEPALQLPDGEQADPRACPEPSRGTLEQLGWLAGRLSLDTSRDPGTCVQGKCNGRRGEQHRAEIDPEQNEQGP